MAADAIHVFIDTNIFLSFYSYTKDDVEQLKKLTLLIRTGLLKLYLPEQVKFEFYRNRENTLMESLRQFEKFSVSQSIPRFMNDYDSIQGYRSALASLMAAQRESLRVAKEQARDRSIGADQLFSELVEVAGVIPTTETAFRAAARRNSIGNPPGKSGALGDRINWEVLLETVKVGTNLHIISRDGDYASALDQNSAGGFIENEWFDRKSGTLRLYSELTTFVMEYFPAIRLAVDAEKRAAMNKLINSYSFAATHSAIAQLLPFIDVLTPTEIGELLDAGESNLQIMSIAADDDVQNFYHKLLQNDRADSDQWTRLANRFALPDSLAFDEH